MCIQGATIDLPPPPLKKFLSSKMTQNFWGMKIFEGGGKSIVAPCMIYGSIEILNHLTKYVFLKYMAAF